MQEIIQQVGILLLGAVPTALLFIILVLSYQFLVQGPLTATLKERRARTDGAVEDAHQAIAQAEARAAEYALKTAPRRAPMSTRCASSASSSGTSNVTLLSMPPAKAAGPQGRPGQSRARDGSRQRQDNHSGFCRGLGKFGGRRGSAAGCREFPLKQSMSHSRFSARLFWLGFLAILAVGVAVAPLRTGRPGSWLQARAGQVSRRRKQRVPPYGIGPGHCQSAPPAG